MHMRASGGAAPRPRPVSTVAGALWREFEAIHGETQAAALGQGPDASLRAYCEAALKKEQAALCISGGGVRSGSFALGVIQALAKRGLLTRFHYLSTVSGGGYIGGWLMAMLRGHDGDAEKVQTLLASNTSPPELKALRRYTSYLAPSAGLFSPDVWAGVTLWVRNVLINWLIFLPALLALALLPACYADIIGTIHPGWLSTVLLCIALLCLGVAVYNGADYLPGHVEPSARMGPGGAWIVPVRVVAPMMVWVALVPVIVGPWLRPVMPLNALSGDVIPLLAFAVTEFAALAAALRKRLEPRLFRQNLVAWTIAALSSSAVLWVWLDLAIGTSPVTIAVLGPAAVTSSHLVLTLVFVSLRVEAYRGDLDREWLGRLSGEKIVPSIIWGLFAAVCLILPTLVIDRWESSFKPLLVGLWLAAGPIAAYVGKISKDMPGLAPSKNGSFVPSLALVTDVVAVIFGTGLFMLLATIGARLTGRNLSADLILLVISLLLAYGLGRRINVNRFSMHAVYRRRLVRGFLGPAREKRNPDPFTGIDPMDNPRMSRLFQRSDSCRMLFPVINVTLNLVAGRDTAWKERKAESFTITPISCGGAHLDRTEDIAAGLKGRGAYVTTEDYAGDERRDGPGDHGRGISLGTAMTISGAAVSPSMGYHSSPATAFLMTLFNVRLGAWLPNPAVAHTRNLLSAKPPNALLSLTREILGLTNDRGRDVYLSDGGHFENLGVYEMIRRRCRYIFVIDAGQDRQAHFSDLGNAVRKIRIDFDVDIDFEPPVGIGSRLDPASPYVDFACATIRYPEAGAPPGYLIYLKPSYPPYVAIDVKAYGNLHDAFPHESTIDQFFTESQFESYRQLGEIEATRLAPEASTIVEFFTAAKAQITHHREEPSVATG
jgi:Patatin-like phospholipase